MQVQHPLSHQPKRRVASLALCAAILLSAATPARADGDFEDAFERQLGRILAFEAVSAGKALLYGAAAYPAYYPQPAVHYAPPVVVHTPPPVVVYAPPVVHHVAVPAYYAPHYGNGHHGYYRARHKHHRRHHHDGRRGGWDD